MSEQLEKPEITIYKGNQILCLPNGAFNFSFGVKKAICILENLEVIKKFVESNGRSIK